MQTAMMDFNRMSLVIPAEITSQKAWVGYVTRQNNGTGRQKIHNVMTGAPAKSNDPATWANFETTFDLAIQRTMRDIGFMFQPPYWEVDIDHCVKDGTIAPYALEILKALNSYAEYSPSGTGIHILVKVKYPGLQDFKIGLEIYTRADFLQLPATALKIIRLEVNERTDVLKDIFNRFVDRSPADDVLSLVAKVKTRRNFSDCIPASGKTIIHSKRSRSGVMQ
jgi:putative DNA primase/helicase